MNPTKTSESVKSKILEAALELVTRHGFHVFPLNGKVPPKGSRGFYDATADPDLVRTAFEDHPAANIGVRTGAESGIWVLDVDGAPGEASLQALVNEHGDLPATWQVVTGKGWHLYFRHPGIKIPPSSSKLGEKLDIRGDGAYVVAPGSRHPSGRTYEWADSANPDNMDAPADAPDWLLSLVREDTDATPSTPVEKRFAQKTDRPREITESFNGSPSGRRNDDLNRYILSRLARGLSPDEVRALALEMARNATPAYTDKNSVLENINRTIKKFEFTPGRFNLTDVGNAKRLAFLHGDDIRYTPAMGYLVYDGGRWAHDEHDTIRALARDVALYTRGEAHRVSNDENLEKAFRKWAAASESAGHIDAMVRLLRSEPGISMDLSSFDRDPMLLNVENGTVDLRTGTLRPHNRDDFLTKMAPVNYDPKAECPTFQKFFREILPDESVRNYLRAVLGYCVTGATKEEVWLFLWGRGANGKSTLLAVLRSMLGGYAVNTPADTFMQKSGDTIRNDLARLRGARLVTSSEPQARKFDPELVKAFVGRDPITARFLRQEFFEYEPVGKLLFAANQRPQVSDNSLGFWRRVRMIPFTEDFRQCRDENLREKLIAESPGILNWLVKACLKWQVMGLNPPAAVSEAVNDYREATDILWEFLHTRSEMGPGLTIAVSALYDNYLDFCDEKKTKHPLSRQKFNEDLRGRDGIIQTKEGAAAHRVRVWKGIGLKCSGSASCQCGNEEGCVRTGDRHSPDGCEHYAPLN